MYGVFDSLARAILKNDILGRFLFHVKLEYATSPWSVVPSKMLGTLARIAEIGPMTTKKDNLTTTSDLNDLFLGGMEAH